MRAREIMTSPVVSVRPEHGVTRAAALLTERGFSALPVCDADGELVGIVTEADLIQNRYPIPENSGPDHSSPPAQRPARTVGEVMTSPVVGVTHDADVAVVAQVMLGEHRRCVPIIDGTRLVGVVTRRDVLRVLARTDDQLTVEVREHLSVLGGAGRWSVTVVDGVAEVIDLKFEHAADLFVAQVLAEGVPGVIRAAVHGVPSDTGAYKPAEAAHQLTPCLRPHHSRSTVAPPNSLWLRTGGVAAASSSRGVREIAANHGDEWALSSGHCGETVFDTDIRRARIVVASVGYRGGRRCGGGQDVGADDVVNARESDCPHWRAAANSSGPSSVAWVTRKLLGSVIKRKPACCMRCAMPLEALPVNNGARSRRVSNAAAQPFAPRSVPSHSRTPIPPAAGSIAKAPDDRWAAVTAKARVSGRLMPWTCVGPPTISRSASATSSSLARATGTTLTSCRVHIPSAIAPATWRVLP